MHFIIYYYCVTEGTWPVYGMAAYLSDLFLVPLKYESSGCVSSCVKLPDTPHVSMTTHCFLLDLTGPDLCHIDNTIVLPADCLVLGSACQFVLDGMDGI